MAAFFSKNKKSKLLQKFYEKTGIQLIDEPKGGIPEPLKSERLYYLAQENPRKAIPELLEMIEKYPDVPSFKNHLYNAYVLSNQLSKGKEVQERILKEHPGYIFGFANKIFNTIDTEELKKYEPLLGDPKDIRSLVGHDAPIHITEFWTYQGAAGHVEALTGDIEKAKERLETLIELEAPKEQIKLLAKTIAIGTMQQMAVRHEEMTKGEIRVKSYPKIQLSGPAEAPKLQHPELEIFYEVSISEISKKQISKIMDLPKISLIEDLELILEDSIRRWDYFMDTDYEEDTHEFVIHALFFLGTLNAEKSLNHTLNLLRMGKDFSEYWFSDYMFECFFPTLFSQGKDQLDVFKKYVLEEGLSPFSRALVTETVSQIAIHFPEKKAEVLEWFRSVIQYHLDHPDNDGIIDTVLLGFMIGDIVDLRVTEMIPLIEKIYDKGWTDKIMNGTLESVKEEINLDYHESLKKPLPRNIYEYYSREYQKRRVPILLTEKEQALLDSIQNGKADAMVTEQLAILFSEMEEGSGDFEDEDYYDRYDNYEDEDEDEEPRYIEPYKRETPKVGRNEPCPCGSGKKYKRCCINK